MTKWIVLLAVAGAAGGAVYWLRRRQKAIAAGEIPELIPGHVVPDVLPTGANYSAWRRRRHGTAIIGTSRVHGR